MNSNEDLIHESFPPQGDHYRSDFSKVAGKFITTDRQQPGGQTYGSKVNPDVKTIPLPHIGISPSLSPVDDVIKR
ncbi:MAG TPA: hypothetical protein VEP90_13355 [Methylomirabilota bacterium]|nr:hypothetical protein [Methylomirabilota bacterium]